MTFLEKLQAHIGGLIFLNTQIYWYNTRSYDGIKRRICLLLDAAPGWGGSILDGDALRNLPVNERVKALLLIDGLSKRIWVSEETVEFIQ
jgi:hypothetical protein